VTPERITEPVPFDPNAAVDATSTSLKRSVFVQRALLRRRGLDSRAMDRRLARRNLRTGLITAVIGLLMFALTFVAALMYVG
jgi:hypothetical protein